MSSSSSKYATHTPTWLGGRPSNVGIVAMDIYFPKMFVAQADLEKHNNVSEGLLVSIHVCVCVCVCVRMYVCTIVPLLQPSPVFEPM